MHSYSFLPPISYLPQTNGKNFSCPLNSPPSCNTYVAYFANSPNFLTLTAISDIFDISPQSIARASNIKDENMNLIEDQPLLVHVTCGCSENGNYFFANISHLIKQGESYYYQFAKGIDFLITYVWQPNDNLTLVAATANAKYFGQNFIAATNFSVFIPVKNLPSLS
ncbi:hypothetical protein MtrunA17_Chr8g0373741 [Medicago truncatula]|uniref:Nod-factor receptor 5 n=1 Tax=Medicago truncatula TaxID=3880 RepID=G7LFK3_MEDTR|nr:Nod-factor receptor 5 [Medicago truncatula]RHN42151.1 hypothetical protein MtrunA17_Chr8g0373741 [Medicago truncatula]